MRIMYLPASEPMNTAQLGFWDAEDGEPLYEDADQYYAVGWCIYHGVDNPYLSEDAV